MCSRCQLLPQHRGKRTRFKRSSSCIVRPAREIHTNLGWFREKHAERAVMLLVIFIVALYLRIVIPWASSIQGSSIIINDFDPYIISG